MGSTRGGDGCDIVGRGGELVSGVGLEVGGLNAMLWGLCLGGVLCL